MKELTKTEYEALIDGAELMKSDRYGPKVYRRADATYVKLFRQKRRFTLATIWPYVKRFRANSIALKKRGIDTIQVGELYDCPEIERTIVTYSELQGELLRSVLKNEDNNKLIEQLAAFLSELHDKGIYFRSIHLENIVLQSNGKFGLIDIADMRFRWLPLGPLRRARNFCHLLKYEEDIGLLQVDGKLDFFFDSYLGRAQLGTIRKLLFNKLINKYIDPNYRPAS